MGGPYDGEVFDTDEPVTRMYAMAYLPEFGIEWHRYDHTPGLVSSIEAIRPVLIYRGVEHGESGVTPSNHPWFTNGSNHWREFAQSGRRIVIYAIEDQQ